jgi:O-antigen ligase
MISLIEAMMPMFFLAATYRMVDREFVRMTIKVVLVSGIIASVLGLVSVVYLDSFYVLYPAERYYGWTLGPFWRAVGVTLNPNHLSSYLVIVMLLAMTAGFIKDLKISRGLCYATTLSCVPALLLSFSRAGWIALVAGAAVFLLITRAITLTRKVRIALGATCLLGLVVGTFAWLEPTVFEWLTTRVMKTYWLLTSGEVNRALAGRLTVWHQVGESFFDHPYAGIGYKMLPEKVVMADNNYLCFLGEGGMIGFSIWIVWLLFVLRDTFRTVSRHPLGAFIFSAWVAVLVNMISADVMTFWRTMGLFFSLLAVVAVSTKAKETQK